MNSIEVLSGACVRSSTQSGTYLDNKVAERGPRDLPV